MGHNLYKNNMVYCGEKPWHGLGVELDKPATAEEAIVAAGLAFNIVNEKVLFRDEHFDDKFFNVNEENQKALGIVSGTYKIVQNKDAFGFFDSVVGEGQAVYHTAGALGDGERIWLLAKLPNDLILFGKDTVEKFLCLTNSHDGKSSLRVYFMPVRVVCQNTLNLSLPDAEQGIAIRHTGNLQAKVEEARRVLGFALDYYAEFDKVAEVMATHKMSVLDADSYFERVLRIDEKEKEDVSTRKENQKARLLQLFETGKGNDIPEVRHTLWTAYNAVAEFSDHDRTVKNITSAPSNRLKSIWFGGAAETKQRAFDEAMVLVKKA